MQRSIRAVLVVLLASLVAPSAMAFEPARIALVSADDGRARLDVAGTWPDTCTPQLVDVLVQDRDIVLSASRESAGCSSIPTPYAFSSESVATEDLMPSAGIHRVRLLVEDALRPEPLLAGFALVRGSEAGSSPAMETGFWWADQGGEFGAGPGLGLSVESQAGLISLSVMGYDAAGEATWFFGAGALVDGIAHLDLGRFDGGAGPFARYAAPSDVQLSGIVDIEVLNPSRATLWFSRTDPETGGLELRPLSIVRFHFAQEPGAALLGRWVVTGSQDGERTTRWMDLVRSEVVADGFLLHDAEGNVSLSCDTPPGRASSPPILCRMQGADGDLVEFTEVALRRLSGWDAQGQRTLAFRLD